MNKTSQKLDYLEGLRGIAAFVVLLGHLRRTFFEHSYEVLTERYGYWTSSFLEGFLNEHFAVWIFWVLSGFVLSLKFHREPDREKSRTLLLDASLRRYPRLLLPVLASVLLAWALWTLGAISNHQLADLLQTSDNGWLRRFYLHEPELPGALKSAFWDSFIDFDPATTYNVVLWSMEVEFYGSIFLFAYLFLVGKQSYRWLIYLVTIVALQAVSMTAMNAFVVGLWMCEIFVRQETRESTDRGNFLDHYTFLFVLSVPIMMQIGIAQDHELWNLILSTGVTVLVLMSHPLRKILSTRVPMFLGKISFGLYLVHLPLICALALPIYQVSGGVANPITAAWLTSLTMIAISLLAGWCLWYLADRPAIAFSRSIAKRLQTTSPTPQVSTKPEGRA